MQNTYKVFIKVDNKCNVIAPPESTAFFSAEELEERGYSFIDEGIGDRFHHAQGNYFSKPIMTNEGIYRYRFVGGQIVEKTEQEINEEIAELPPPEPSQDTALMSMAVDHEYRIILMEMGV